MNISEISQISEIRINPAGYMPNIYIIQTI